MCQASTDSEASVFGIIGPNPLFIIYTYLFVNVSYKWIWTSFGELQVIKNKPKLIRGRHFSSRIDFIFLLVAPLGRLMYAFIFCLPSPNPSVSALSCQVCWSCARFLQEMFSYACVPLSTVCGFNLIWKVVWLEKTVDCRCVLRICRKGVIVYIRNNCKKKSCSCIPDSIFSISWRRSSTILKSIHRTRVCVLHPWTSVFAFSLLFSFCFLDWY